MQKKKQVFTWPLSTLVIVVTFLSVLVVLQQVQATWVEPVYLPGDTTASNNFVFSPLAQDLVLNSKNITGNGNISIITGSVSADSGTFDNLTVTNINGSPYSGGGGGGGGSSNDWAINYGSNRALYYATTSPDSSGNVGIGRNNPDQTLVVNGGIGFGASFTSDKKLYASSDGDLEWRTNNAAGAHGFAVSNQGTKSVYLNTSGNSYFMGGNLGIGTNSPNKLLHLYSTTPNAELDIQSVSGSNNHWAMYHDAGTDQLRFWKSAGNDVLSLSANGRVGLGTTPDNNNMLKVSTSTKGIVGVYGENSATDWSFFPSLNPNNIGVKGVASTEINGGVGVYGSGYNGVKGLGFYGVYGESSIASGYGIYGKQGSGLYAGYFDGDVSVTGNLTASGAGKYVQITSGSGAPAANGCQFGAANGRLYVDTTASTPKLYICVNLIWKSIAL